jgi:DNA polymerase-1
VNTRIQGTAADIMKLAMIAVHDGLKTCKSQLIIQVHDEVVVDMATAELAGVQQLVVAAMQSAADLRVPLVVDVAVGNNWQAC